MYKKHVGKDINLIIPEHREFLYIFINEYSNYNTQIKIADDQLDTIMKSDISNGEAIGCSSGCLIGIVFALISVALGASGFWNLLFIFSISFSIIGFFISLTLSSLGIIKSKRTEKKEAKMKNQKTKEQCKIELDKTLSNLRMKMDLLNDNDNEYSDESYKECPFCAEVIKAKAVKCRYCGSELS